MLKMRGVSIVVSCLVVGVLMAGCSAGGTVPSSLSSEGEDPIASDVMASSESADAAEDGSKGPAEDAADAVDSAGEGSEGGEGSTPVVQDDAKRGVSPDNLNLAEDYRESFVHGDKPAECQKYIVLHDTEGGGDAYGVISSWDATGAGVAAHFVVNKDGSVVQCVPLDKIAHHAGYGDAGHNDLYGVVEDGRDDMVGTVPIGDWAPDYGMNAWSVGIEIVHVGGEGAYPEEQLEALDALVAYIDAYYGFESTIIDHKAWRSGNSDTSPEFAECLANYQDHRTHD
jgi:hypothetical protein